MDTSIPPIGRELTVRQVDNPSSSNGFKFLNLPTSMDLTPLLTKLEQYEKDFFPQQPHMSSNKLLQRIKLIELDSYLHESPYSKQLNHFQLSAFNKTRLFFAVGYGSRVVVGQLFALELRHVQEEADDIDHLNEVEELEEEEEEELEWVDVSKVRLIGGPSNDGGESEIGGEITIGPVVIFPPAHAEKLPNSLSWSSSEKFSNHECSKHGQGFEGDEITTCALIPSPSIKRTMNSSDRSQASPEFLTQRNTAVVLGTLNDRVISFSLHVSEVKPAAPPQPVVESPMEIIHDDVKFSLEYTSCKDNVDGKITDPTWNEAGDAVQNTSVSIPFVKQVLPLAKRYECKKDCNENYYSNATNLINIPPLAGVADGNVDSFVEVFQPSLSTIEPDKLDTVRSDNDTKVSKFSGISTITFCRGSLKPDQFHSGDGSKDQQFVLVPDIVWVTYGNGTIVRLPTWKFFLSLNLGEEIERNENSGKEIPNASLPSRGGTVVPFNCHVKSPLDVPPPHFDQPNFSNRPSVGTESNSLKVLESNNNANTTNYWRTLHSAVIFHLREQTRMKNHSENRDAQALVLSDSSMPGSLPLSIQSTRVECAKIQQDINSCEVVDKNSELENINNPRVQPSEDGVGNDMDDSTSSSSEMDKYGPVTGTVVGGTAALVKGALGVAFGAVRWGFGRGVEDDIVDDTEVNVNDETPNDFVDADESFDGEHDESNQPSLILGGNEDYRSLFTQKETSQDLFPWPLCHASLAYCDVPRQFTSAVVDPNGTSVSTTDNLGRVMLFDLETGQLIRMWKGMRNVKCSFAELPRHDAEFDTVLYLVIHLQEKGTVEIYRLRQGPRVTAVSVPKRDECAVVTCFGPPSEKCIVRNFILMSDSDSIFGRSFHCTMDQLVIEDQDLLSGAGAESECNGANLDSRKDSGLQLTLLMQLLAPDTNIAFNLQTVFMTFKQIRSISDLGVGLDILSKCCELDDKFVVTGSDFHSMIVSHCKHRLELAKQQEGNEGSGMIRKAAISDLSCKIAYHERLINAYSCLHHFELKNDRLISDADDSDDWEARRLSAWASEAVTWISLSDGNDAQKTRFSSSFSNTENSEKPLVFSKFAQACSSSNVKKKSCRGHDFNGPVYLSGIKKDRMLLLMHIFRPLLRDMFVYKVTNTVFNHLGISEDYDALQQYFGEWVMTLSPISVAKSNLSGTWRPMVRFLQDLIMSAYEMNQRTPEMFDDLALDKVVQLETLLKFVTDVEDLPKAFTLSVVCLDAINIASKLIEERTYGKITVVESVLPWENLLRKLRLCLLVCLRLSGDVSPTGAVNPFTVKSVNQPDVFSTYAWIARDELSLSHDNQVLLALESACLCSSEAFYPSSIDGDTVPHKRSILESCSCHRPSASLRNPTGLTNDDNSRPLIFYLKDHANCPAHLAAHRGLILAGLWGQTPDNLDLIKSSIAAMKIVLDNTASFTLAVLVEVYQSRIRPVCRAMIFGFDDVHELSQDVVLPLINDPSWKRGFFMSAKTILSMISKCESATMASSLISSTYDDTGQEMWPPLREDPVLKGLESKVRRVHPSSVELHHAVIFAAPMLNDTRSLEAIIPSFSDLFLLGSLSLEIPPMPQGTDLQRNMIDEAILEQATSTSNFIIDRFDFHDIEWVAKAWGFDSKYVHTRYMVEMIRLGKDSCVDNLMGSCIHSLDKELFVDEIRGVLCVRLDAIIASLKKSRNYRGVVSLLDADTSRYVRDIAAKFTPSKRENHAPVSLVTTHSLMMRTQSMCEDIDDVGKRKDIDALCVMSGTLLKAVQAQEQQAAINV
ncbi:hypothetical protein ACHAXS_014010 [Conticribra weissflogii]